MRRLKHVWALLLLILITSSIPVQTVLADSTWPAGPEVHAESAIVIEADSGTILYEKNIHTQHYPASITKIMTTLLALENSSPQDIVTFSRDSIYKTEGSRAGFMEGEELPMEHCLYAVMLASANEGAYAVAEHVGGTIEAFVEKMNSRAAALGCTETHFSNPHGLPDDTHVTSAHDMALIAREAYKNEMFRTITRTTSYIIPATNKSAETRPISNHHSMLKPGPYKYAYCTGGKTGYTNAARNTLVTYAEKDGITLISVIMRDDISQDQYLDTIALLDYGFNNFKKLPINENDLGLQLSSNGFFPIKNNPLSKDSGQISLDSSIQLVVPNRAVASDIVPSIHFTGSSSGEIASVACSLGEHLVGNVPIIYTPGRRPAEPAPQTEAAQKEPAESRPFPVKQVLLAVFTSLCILGVLLVILYSIRNGIFELDYVKEGPKLKRHKNIRRRSLFQRKSREKEPKTTVHKPVGTAQTPRLQSEFDTFDAYKKDHLQTIDDDLNDSLK